MCGGVRCVEVLGVRCVEVLGGGRESGVDLEHMELFLGMGGL